MTPIDGNFSITVWIGARGTNFRAVFWVSLVLHHHLALLSKKKLKKGNSFRAPFPFQLKAQISVYGKTQIEETNSKSRLVYRTAKGLALARFQSSLVSNEHNHHLSKRHGSSSINYLLEWRKALLALSSRFQENKFQRYSFSIWQTLKFNQI